MDNKEEVTCYPDCKASDESLSEETKEKLKEINKLLDEIITKDNFNYIFDCAIIKYMKYRNISTLDIIASEVSTENKTNLEIYKSNMRKKDII